VEITVTSLNTTHTIVACMLCVTLTQELPFVEGICVFRMCKTSALIVKMSSVLVSTFQQYSIPFVFEFR